MAPIEQILIVTVGTLVTVLLAAALTYWINREWRDLRARRRERCDAGCGSMAEIEPDEPPADPPLGS